MYKRVLHTTSLIVILILLIVRTSGFGVVRVVGYTAPTPPPAPSAPSAPEAPSAPTPPPAPTSSTVSVSPTPTPTPVPTVSDTTNTTDIAGTEQFLVPEDTSSTTTDTATTQADSYTEPIGETTGNIEQNRVTGDTEIVSGTADTSGTFFTDVNTNLLSADSGGSDEIVIQNTDNGADSTNDIQINSNSDTLTFQDNNAVVVNDISLESISGDNEASRNVGDSAIITGDANTSLALVNSVNTNIDGVTVAEFNVEDVHTGDLVIEFPETDTSGCSTSICGGIDDVALINADNGADSDNSLAVTNTQNNTTVQTNVAEVQNNITLVADSGNNETNRNTGGDNSIETGDANVSATVSNFVNNNITGPADVLLAIVNIFGELIGDIVLPEGYFADGNSNTTITNTGNGSGSTNDLALSNTTNNTLVQTNTSDIVNNISVDAITGDNQTSDNTAGFSNGDNSIDSGDAYIDLSLITVANSNIASNDGWWLVFVNKLGEWTGQIMGAPEGALFAGSSGSEFIVSPDGSISVTNAGNGADSNNTVALNQTTNNQTFQTNTANVTNNLNLTANTGGNRANDNTGGASTIKTGDASVIGEIVNFVNNNFSGKVMLTLVNVFDRWNGNFVPPGYESVTSPIGEEDIADTTTADTNNSNDQKASETTQQSDTTDSTHESDSHQDDTSADTTTAAIVSPLSTDVSVFYDDEYAQIPHNQILAGFVQFSQAASTKAAELVGSSYPVTSPLPQKPHTAPTVLIGGIRLNTMFVELLSVVLLLVLVRRMLWIGRRFLTVSPVDDAVLEPMAPPVFYFTSHKPVLLASPKGELL